MSTGTVRLQAFADLTRRSREAIRNAQKTDTAPWDEKDFNGAAQRQYTGYHALAEVLKEILMAQRCNAHDAAFTVRTHKRAIEKFLDEVDNDLPITSRFVISMQVAIEDSWTGASWMGIDVLSYGTAEEIIDAISGEIHRIGHVSVTRGGKSTRRIIGGPNVIMASIPETYRLLQLRAKEAGYQVNGRQIIKIDPAVMDNSS